MGKPQYYPYLRERKYCPFRIFSHTFFLSLFLASLHSLVFSFSLTSASRDIGGCNCEGQRKKIKIRKIEKRRNSAENLRLERQRNIKIKRLGEKKK